MSGLEGHRLRKVDGATVLAYHSVLPTRLDGVLDSYAIDAPSFRSHVRFFRRDREIVPLSTVARRLEEGGSVPSRWTALTLDDALLNQVTTAADILTEEGVPWALAVPAGLVESGRSVWTYELRLLVMECWPFPTIASPLPGRAALPTTSAVERNAALGHLFPALFRGVDDGRRTAYLEELIDRAGREQFLARVAKDPRLAIAGWPAIRRLQAAGVEVLSHGWKHRPQNDTITPASLEEEIVRSRQVIEERIGVAPAGFALPHSARAAGTNDLLESAGFAYCLSSRPARVRHGADLWDLPRFSAEYTLPVLRRYVLRR